jgi:glycosyltransferase involved in cell wall biosynthesis
MVNNIIISIPAYNEGKTIAGVIKEINTVMNKTNYKFKILVVNDGSKDDTAKQAKQSGATVYSHPKNYGLAETFRTEMDQCLLYNPDIIVHTDADGQYQAKDIPRLIRQVEKGYDLVLGNRFRGGIEHMPLLKKIGNKAFSRVISHIVGKTIGDGQTGFRAFTKEVAEKVKINSSHTYTQQQIIVAIKEKFSIKEIPTRFRVRGAKTKSRLMKNPFEYAFKAWINILRVYRDYEPIKFFGIFGTLFLGVGSIIGIGLLFLFAIKGTIEGRLPTAILSALFILVGVQIILFGFLADMKKQ